MKGHEPAPLAILDCLELGLIQPIDGAIRSEMSVFSALIQRPEPRNMIRTMFLGKQAYDKAERSGSQPDSVKQAAASVAEIIAGALKACPELSKAGFASDGRAPEPVQQRPGADFWFRSDANLTLELARVGKAISEITARLTDEENLLLDHACVRERTIPAYLGGPGGLVAFST
jgi:3-hydroxyacyl-CoA dehydrogenase/enoyl-CoA hydratase/3-hydroxybutyryl-CoA epimerase